MGQTVLELDKTADYTTLREWCIVCCDFIVKEYPEMSDFVDQIKQVVKDTDKKKSIRQMRTMYKEVNWMIQDGYLSDATMEALNKTLTEKFNYNLRDVAAYGKDKIQKIIKRGRICDDEEYELVKRQEEEIYNDESQYLYSESLRSLLGDYEMNL